jgi:hypothetical protein
VKPGTYGWGVLPTVRLARLALPLILVLAVPALAALPNSSAAGSDDDDRGRVARLAVTNGLSIAAMRDLLRDPAVRLTDSGRVYYVDPGAQGRVGPTAARAVAPLRQTFGLHSYPGSRRTIYLDFDGTVVKGTAWNRQVGVRNGWHAGWDPGNNGRGFSDREKRIVQSVWARVAEDYAPFNVDVTTEEPREARIHRTTKRDKVFGTRVLISESGDAHSRICSRQCGGVSFLNVFSVAGRAHRRHQPSWVFPAGLSGDVKAVAESATHEAGHTFGLVHDGTRTLLGVDPYYTGHGAWAPIMGAAYERPISQWSRGSYSGATSRQDDLAIIAHRGAPFRRDEAGARPRSAGRLPQGKAYISRRGDVDVFRLGQCGGRIKVRAVVARISPNLDVRLRLLRKDRVVASANPPSARVSRDRASGLNATIGKRVRRGIYFAEVDGVGRGNPSSSYDDYGSLGAYRLSVSGC